MIVPVPTVQDWGGSTCLVETFGGSFAMATEHATFCGQYRGGPVKMTPISNDERHSNRHICQKCTAAYNDQLLDFFPGLVGDETR